MLINADFSQSVFMTPEQYQWTASPQPGVDRVMLDRIGAEKARATSLVRYAQLSVFPVHDHPQGEEILVLEGVFSEQGHDYPAGWYLRNPDGTSHQPSSKEGAVIFVKLRQMREDDQQSVRINSQLAENWHTETMHGDAPPQAVCELFQNENETVQLRQLQKNDVLALDVEKLTEILIIAGALTSDGQYFPKHSWLRLAQGSTTELIAATDQVIVYIKTMKHITNLD